VCCVFLGAFDTPNNVITFSLFILLDLYDPMVIQRTVNMFCRSLEAKWVFCMVLLRYVFDC
jgi:hypothetical protein